MRATAANAALLAGCLLLSGQAAAERVQVRASSMLPAVMLERLSQLAEADRFELPQGWTVERLLRSHCGGSYSRDYQAMFEMLNDPATAPMAARPGRRLDLPPCPRVLRQTRDVVQPRDTLDTVLRRATGTDASVPALRCRPDPRSEAEEQCDWVPARDLVAGLNGGASAGLDALAPGRTLTLPYRTGATVIRLKPGVTLQAAMEQLQAVAATTPAGTALLSIEEEQFAPFDALSDDDHRLAQAACDTASGELPNWPFDQGRVRAAIADGLAHLQARGGAPRRVTLRIADNGFSGIGTSEGIPLAALQINERDASVEGDGNSYRGDRFGINADGGGDIGPLPNLDSPWHGTEVAQLSLGGRGFRDATPDVTRLMGLNFARMYRIGRPWPEPAMLADALRVHPPRPHIVNLSMGGPRRSYGADGIGEALLRGGQLLVVAAGNNGRLLSSEPSYPASEPALQPWVRHALIVVGAHGPNGALTEFSNRGLGQVDLVAPGCAIARSDEAPGRLHGTSFAAPLVSFAAAGVAGLLPGAEPARIKERLQLTARRLLRGEAQLVSSGGAVDIEAALRVFDDVVRLRAGTPMEWHRPPLYGRWTASVEHELSLCGSPVGGGSDASQDDENPPRPRAARIARIRVLPGTGEPPRLAILERDINQVVQEQEATCRAAGAVGPTLVLPDGTSRAFLWKEIAAFVPAFNILDRRGVPAPPLVAAANSPIPVATRRPDALVRQVQEALASRQFYAGPIDGLAGPSTLGAILEFQRARNEAPTGLISPVQLRALAVP